MTVCPKCKTYAYNGYYCRKCGARMTVPQHRAKPPERATYAPFHLRTKVVR